MLPVKVSLRDITTQGLMTLGSKPHFGRVVVQYGLSFTDLRQVINKIITNTLRLQNPYNFATVTKIKTGFSLVIKIEFTFSPNVLGQVKPKFTIV